MRDTPSRGSYLFFSTLLFLRYTSDYHVTTGARSSRCWLRSSPKHRSVPQPPHCSRISRNRGRRSGRAHGRYTAASGAWMPLVVPWDDAIHPPAAGRGGQAGCTPAAVHPAQAEGLGARALAGLGVWGCHAENAGYLTRRSEPLRGNRRRCPGPVRSHRDTPESTHTRPVAPPQGSRCRRPCHAPKAAPR